MTPLQFVTRLLAVLLLMLTWVVSVPLTIRIWRDSGPWGFGIVGLQLLLPLDTYILFSMAALLKSAAVRWWMFVAAHVVSVTVGIFAFFIFPVLPKVLLVLPVSIALISIAGRKRSAVFLVLMLVFGGKRRFAEVGT